MTFEDLLKETISYPTRNGKRREIQVATAYWNERHPAHSYAVQFVKSRLPKEQPILSKPPSSPRAQVQQSGFFSDVEQIILNKVPEKASPQQVIGILKNNGASKTELDWLGIESWLQNQKSVSKNDAVAFVRKNGVRVKVSGLKDDEEAEEEADTWREREKEDALRGMEFPGKSFFQVGESDVNMPDEESLEYSEYRPKPVGDNYREILLQLPGVDANYTSGHFSESENIAAWIRADDRETDHGDSVFFVNEVQSDWAGDIRKKGKLDAMAITKLENALKEVTAKKDVHLKEWEKADQELGKEDHPNVTAGEERFATGEVWYYKGRELSFRTKGMAIAYAYRQEGLTSPAFKRVEETAAIVNVFNNEINDLRTKLNGAKNAAPDMPFSDTWYQLAIKKALQIAAEEGYDRIAWTTGQQQYGIYGLKESEHPFHKELYDKMIPSFLSKFVRKWGATVDTVIINGQRQMSVEINEPMRAALLKGVPLFSSSSQHVSERLLFLAESAMSEWTRQHKQRGSGKRKSHQYYVKNRTKLKRQSKLHYNKVHSSSVFKSKAKMRRRNPKRYRRI